MVNKTLVIIFTVILLTTSLFARDEKEKHWRFVRRPDFLNVDTNYLQKGWEDALSFVLQSVKKENPDFLTVAGDLVMGHWHGESKYPGIKGIQYYASQYYSEWKERIKAHGLKYYAAIGDHEIGDNPWNYEGALENVKAYNPKRYFLKKYEFSEERGLPD